MGQNNLKSIAISEIRDLCLTLSFDVVSLFSLGWKSTKQDPFNRMAVGVIEW